MVRLACNMRGGTMHHNAVRDGGADPDWLAPDGNAFVSARRSRMGERRARHRAAIPVTARGRHRSRIHPAAQRSPGPDRWLSPELAAADQLLTDEALVPAVESATAPLV